MNKRRISLGTTKPRLSDFPAIIDSDITLSYRDVHRLVASVADKLQTGGIKRGQRVGIISGNSAACIITLMALIHQGAIACPVSTRYPVGSVEQMLGSINCDTVIATNQYSFESASLRFIPMFDIHKTENPEDTLPDIDMNQDATILFTSGTTTVPKAVLHTYGNHYYSALSSNQNIPLDPGYRWLLSLPLYHVGGLGIIFRCFLSGATVIVGGHGESISESIQKHGITHLSLVPTQLQSLLDEMPQGDTFANVKCALIGGGYCPLTLIEKALAKGLPIRTTYGSTEMASQITTTGPDDAPEKLRTSGKLLEHRELKIFDDGEILVRGSTLFKGYVTSSGIELPSDSNGWFATGDLGEIDSEGYLTVTGRKDNMFISGGENVYPEEIEAAIRLLDGIDDAIVVPIDDVRYGQRPVAFIKLKENAELTPAILLDQLLDRLPKFKIPAEILTWPDDAPQTGIKPDRTYFKKLARQSRG